MGLQAFQDDDEIRKSIKDILDDVKTRKFIYTKEEQFRVDLYERLKDKVKNGKYGNIDIMVEDLAYVEENKATGKFEKKSIDIILIDDDGNYIAIELKYKKHGCISFYNVGGSKMNCYLGHDGAEDLGRFDYLWDVYRLENLKELVSHRTIIDKYLLNLRLKKCISNYAIMLSNEDKYLLDEGGLNNTVCKLIALNRKNNIKEIRWNHAKPLCKYESYTSDLHRYLNLEDDVSRPGKLEQKVCVFKNPNGYKIEINSIDLKVKLLKGKESFNDIFAYLNNGSLQINDSIKFTSYLIEVN